MYLQTAAALRVALVLGLLANYSIAATFLLLVAALCHHFILDFLHFYKHIFHFQINILAILAHFTQQHCRVDVWPVPPCLFVYVFVVSQLW